MKTKQEHSAGGPVFKQLATSDKKQAEVVWLLGKHSGYHKWVLPKGMIEDGETPQETAVRETEEELAIKARIVELKPIHEDHYSYKAILKEANDRPQAIDASKPERRVALYQENEDFTSNEDEIVLVNKTVTFFLMEYLSGDCKDHGWEMEDAGWFSTEEALEKLAFEGEKEALRKANAALELG